MDPWNFAKKQDCFVTVTGEVLEKEFGEGHIE
jgi:hypothetical protein